MERGIKDPEGMEILLHLNASEKSRELCAAYFYVVNLESARVTKLTFGGGDVLFEASCFSSMAALDDEIYMIGGARLTKLLGKWEPSNNIRRYVHSDVSRINLVDLVDGWKNVTPLNSEEHDKFPCVTYNNKIYVFGGAFPDTHTPCPGEVYDPVLDHWEFLPASDDDCNYYGSDISYPVLVDSKNNRIILHSKLSIYAYYPDQRHWVCLVENFRSWQDNLTAVFDDMLISHSFPSSNQPSTITAFDLVTKKWLIPVFSDNFDTRLLANHFSDLIPMGGDGTFCFAAHSHCSTYTKTSLIFLKFRVHRNHNQSRDPLFTFLSHRHLSLPWGFHVLNFLAIGEMSKRKDTSEEAFANSSVNVEDLKWTDAMDEILVDGLIEQAKLGNCVGGIFTTTAYDNILTELKEKFPHKNVTMLKFTSHLKNKKKKFTQWYNVFKEGLSGFSWDPMACKWDAESAVWDKLIEEKPAASKLRNKKFPLYYKFVEVYGKDRATSDNAHIAVEMRAKLLAPGSLIENFDDTSFENWGGNAQKVGILHPDDCTTRNSAKRAKDKAKAIDVDSHGVRERGKLKVIEDASDGVGGSLWWMGDSSFKPVAKLMNSSDISIDLSSIWTLLEEMEVGEDIPRAYCFLAKNLDSLKVLLACPIQNRKEVLKILMQPS